MHPSTNTLKYVCLVLVSDAQWPEVQQLVFQDQLISTLVWLWIERWRERYKWCKGSYELSTVMINFCHQTFPMIINVHSTHVCMGWEWSWDRGCYIFGCDIPLIRRPLINTLFCQKKCSADLAECFYKLLKHYYNGIIKGWTHCNPLHIHK